MLWRQWKRNRTRAARLMQQGLVKERAWKSAGNGRGSWWNSGASHMNEAFSKRYFDQLGLVSLLNQKRRVLKTARTAGYGTVRLVVWEDGASLTTGPSYPIMQRRCHGRMELGTRSHGANALACRLSLIRRRCSGHDR
jgi:RNA-directed DNA polymerase